MQLTTARLTARPFDGGDHPNLCLIHGDPFVMRTLSLDGRPLPDSTTRRWVEAFRADWIRAGFGVWSFRLSSNGDFVGYCGLQHCLVEGAPEVELLYGQRSVFWRQGFASEMARAVLADGKNRIEKIPSLVAFTLPHNLASRGVMERNGFHYERDIRHKGLAHVLYRRAA